MPLIDMPLDELKTYQGRNPRPDDFDEYWDTALAEMQSVDPRVELSPSGYDLPNAECLRLYFTGVGGARIHAKYVRPKNLDRPAPAIVLFHGYTWRADDWFNLLSWTSQGFCVAAMECRGQGGFSEDVGGVKGNTHNGHIIRGLDDSPEKLLYRSIFLDTAQLAGIVMGLPEVDGSRVGAAGGSQGGGLTLACAALEPRIKRAAPIYPFLCDYLRVWEMDLAEGAYAELKTHFKFFDPLHERENGSSPASDISITSTSRAESKPSPDAGRADGLGLPAIHPVRGLQQDHVEKRAAHISRLWSRGPDRSVGCDPAIHARDVNPLLPGYARLWYHITACQRAARRVRAGLMAPRA